MKVTGNALQGEAIHNYINLTATNRHYRVTVTDPAYIATDGLLNVINEISKYRRRMEFVLENHNRFNVYSAGFYVGHLRAGRVGRSSDISAIFGSPTHSRPRASAGLEYNEEYSSNVKTAAKEAVQLYVPAKKETVVEIFKTRVGHVFNAQHAVNNKENTLASGPLDNLLLEWKNKVIGPVDRWNSDTTLIRKLAFLLLDAYGDLPREEGWDFAEAVDAHAELRTMMRNFRSGESYVETYKKIMRNKLRRECMIRGGLIMCVNKIGKPTLILRSTVEGGELKAPLEIYTSAETVEELPDNIQTAYHAVRMAGLNTYVEGMGMYVSDDNIRTTDDRILGSCVWLDPQVYPDYTADSLS